MNELREMIDEIRRIRNVQPGDQMAANEHFGYLGQLLENLIYAFDSADQSWQEVEDNPVYTLDKTGQRVFLQDAIKQTTRCYLDNLKKELAA
jgi:hypothetical protein